jgi:hypothetical protein
VAGAAPPRLPPGSSDGKEGAPWGDDDDRDDTDVAVFAGRSQDDDKTQILLQSSCECSLIGAVATGAATRS